MDINLPVIGPNTRQRSLTAEPAQCEPAALIIAARLRRRWGDACLGAAQAEYLRALECGMIARADLYRAVWSALRYRDRVEYVEAG